MKPGRVAIAAAGLVDCTARGRHVVPRRRLRWSKWQTAAIRMLKQRLPSWAGLDVGVETTSICVINETGEPVHEACCPTTIEAVHRELRFLKRRKSASVGMEAGVGVALARGLRSLGYTIRIYEARQLSKFLRLRRNKTDAGDANGIAQAGRLGAALVSEVHLKSLECQLLSSRLTIRRHLVRSRVKASNLLCRQLELYGGRVRVRTAHKGFRAEVELQIRKYLGRGPNPVADELRRLLDHCEELVEHERRENRALKKLAFESDVCRRLMEIPGVGPLCALTFMAAVGEPHRFRRTADIGSYLGLTPRLLQSGLTFRQGRISKMGSTATRTLLIQSSMRFMITRSCKETALYDWARAIAERRGKMKANVALARKLATIMLSLWKSGNSYRAVPRSPVAAGYPGLDLDAATGAVQARRDDPEAAPRVTRPAFGPKGRALFPVLRQNRQASRKRPWSAPSKREVPSISFVLLG